MYHCAALRLDCLACLQGVPVARPPLAANIDASTGGPLQLTHVPHDNAIPENPQDAHQPVIAPAAQIEASATAQVMTAPMIL